MENLFKWQMFGFTRKEVADFLYQNRYLFFYKSLKRISNDDNNIFFLLYNNFDYIKILNHFFFYFTVYIEKNKYQLFIETHDWCRCKNTFLSTCQI